MEALSDLRLALHHGIYACLFFVNSDGSLRVRFHIALGIFFVCFIDFLLPLALKRGMKLKINKQTKNIPTNAHSGNKL